MPLAMRVSRFALPALALLAISSAAFASDDSEKSKDFCCKWKSDFGAYAQVSLPLRDLDAQMDGRHGFGLGAQWIHDHGECHASRTRLEYNVFAEGNPVGSAGVKTYTKNYLASFDHLFKLNNGPTRAYLVAGLGGVRWVQDQTIAGTTSSFQTTKLAVTGGAGLQVCENVSLEMRYVFSGIRKTFDANTLQASVGWKF